MKADIAGRIGSRDDSQHNGAVFELLLHELLRRMGCQMTPHPDTGSGTGTHPDYLVQCPVGDFYLEARALGGVAEAQRAAEKRVQTVYDYLDDLQSDFFLAVQVRTWPQTQPSARRVRDEIERWLKGLDPDQVTHDAQAQGPAAPPRLTYSHDGLTVDLEAHPKRSDARGKPGVRAIGMLVGSVKLDQYHESIKEAVKKKGSHYGELGLPLVVALNLLDIGCDEEDVLDALFGPWQVSIAEENKSVVAAGHSGEGAFGSKALPSCMRVSGVLACFGLSPERLEIAETRLYHHPWALKPYDSVLCELAQATLEGACVASKEGRAVRSFFEDGSQAGGAGSL